MGISPVGKRYPITRRSIFMRKSIFRDYGIVQVGEQKTQVKRLLGILELYESRPDLVNVFL